MSRTHESTTRVKFISTKYWSQFSIFHGKHFPIFLFYSSSCTNVQNVPTNTIDCAKNTTFSLSKHILLSSTGCSGVLIKCFCLRVHVNSFHPSRRQRNANYRWCCNVCQCHANHPKMRFLRRCECTVTPETKLHSLLTHQHFHPIPAVFFPSCSGWCWEMYTMHSTQLYLYAMIIWREEMMTNTIKFDNKTRFLPSDICDIYVALVRFYAKNHRLPFDFLYCTGARERERSFFWCCRYFNFSLIPPLPSSYNNSRFIPRI